MALMNEVTREWNRSIETLRHRSENTPYKAEKKALLAIIGSLQEDGTALVKALPMEASVTIAAAIASLEKAVAAAKHGPFNGYLACIESHIDNLYRLSGEICNSERFQPATDEGSGSRSLAPSGRGVAITISLPKQLKLPEPVTDYSVLQAEYQSYFDTCTVRPEYERVVNSLIDQMKQKQGIYEQVGADLGGIPWYFIGLIHAMECGFNFAGHMHNGDPLTKRTVHEPVGRPIAGTPPFTWRFSAVDAMTMKKFHTVKDWSIPHMLYKLEGYNGFGYRLKFRLPSPYLWSFSNLYQKGKYVADRQFSPDAISKQCGAAVLLKVLLSGKRSLHRSLSQ